MGSGFVHDLDPVLFRLGPVAFYYYGLAYAIGVLGLHGWLGRRRTVLGWPASLVYDFTIIVSVGVLIVGRAFEIIVYERAYFLAHPGQLLYWWQGGMASHGVLFGGVLGAWAFARLRQQRLLRLLDEIAIPAALFLAVGRIGNFINGEIVGSVTDVPWAVKFPEVDGVRHPVALYESLKNLLLIPILFSVRRRWAPGAGGMTAHFILWYGALRVLTDWFRDYPTRFLGIGAGQYFNLGMLLLGAVLLLLVRQRRPGEGIALEQPAVGVDRGLTLRRIVLVAILVFFLLIPSSWSRGGLEYYRNTHASAPTLSSRRPGRRAEPAPRLHRGSGRSWVSSPSAVSTAICDVRLWRSTPTCTVILASSLRELCRLLLAWARTCAP